MKLSRFGSWNLVSHEIIFQVTEKRVLTVAQVTHLTMTNP